MLTNYLINSISMLLIQALKRCIWPIYSSFLKLFIQGACQTIRVVLRCAGIIAQVQGERPRMCVDPVPTWVILLRIDHVVLQSQCQ